MPTRIVFPLAMPASYKVRNVEFEAVQSAGVNVSPFTLEEQIYEHQGECLQVSVSCPPMLRANAEKMVAWLLALRAGGTFLLPPPGYGAGARGSLAGSPTVMGSGQSGALLASDGWTPSAQGVLLEGDWIQIGTGATARLYKNLTVANADVYGQVDLDLWPRLRESPNDNDPITVVQPVGLFRLAEPNRKWNIAEAMIYGVEFVAREAI